MSSEPQDPARRRVESWKQIGGHFGVTDRTAQRWYEKEELPVRREGKRVFAYEDELERWRVARQNAGASLLEVPPPAASQASFRGTFQIAFAIAVCILVAVLLKVALTEVRPQSSAPPRMNLPRWLSRATAEGGSFRALNFPHDPDLPVLSPDGRRLYIVSYGRSLIQVLDTESLKSRVVPLPTVARSLSVSADGKRLFVGSASDGVVVLEAPHGPVLETISTGAPVSDLVVTPDGGKLFAAMAHHGVRSLDLKRRTWRQLTWQGCPEFVSMDNVGKFLVVSYRCGGPGGREGHDAVEVIDAASERSIHVLNGLPLVGGKHIFSPDGSLLFLDGWDACETPHYDHEGCPSVPSKIGHLISVPDWKVLRTIGFLTGSVATAYFLPDGWRALTARRALAVFDFRNYRMIEHYTEPGLVYWGGAVSNDGKRAYFARRSSSDLVVLEAEDAVCAEVPTGLVSLLTGDGIPSDVIESQTIQPQSAVSYAPGFVGQAFAINATVPKPRIEWKSHLLFGFAESTLTFYMKPVASGPILHWLDGQTGNEWSLTLLDGGHLEFNMRWGTRWRAQLRSATPTPFSAWTHVGVTAGREQITLFVNGVRQASARFPSEPPRGHDRYIDVGWRPDTTSRFEGLVDEIAFWARALRPEEVQALYRQRVQPQCRP